MPFGGKQNEAFIEISICQILILGINRFYDVLNCYVVHNNQSHIHKKLSYDESAYGILLACFVAQIDIQHFYYALQLQILLEQT